MATQQEKEKGKVPSEIGTTGVYSKNIGSYFDEGIKDLTFPHSLDTYDKMAMDVTIASALNAVNVIASRVHIYVESYDQSNIHKKRADFVMQCLKDLDDGESLENIVQKALTLNKYGFSILEKVFRRRRHKFGSKYDDGKIGIKALPMRNQHSISGFKWDENFRKVEGLYQANRPKPPSYYNYFANNIKNPLLFKPTENDTFIPRNRYLHFKADLSSDLPESVSPLYACYGGWRELQRHKDMENIAASKNMNGILVGRIPQEYLAADADEDMRKAGDVVKGSLSKLAVNEQAAIVLPSTRSDDAHGSLDWDVTTLQSSSSHVTSISDIVKRLQNEILQLMFADILRSGDEVTNVSKNKKSMLNMLVETRVQEVLRVLNNDLIPELFRRNGWDDSKLPTLRYGELEEVDMAVFAKAMQQLKATKLIPVTPNVINRVLEIMGFTYRVPDDMTKEELDELLGTNDDDDSRSGDGLSKGSGNGTSDNVSEADPNANNLNKN